MTLMENHWLDSLRRFSKYWLILPYIPWAGFIIWFHVSIYRVLKWVILVGLTSLAPLNRRIGWRFHDPPNGRPARSVLSNGAGCWSTNPNPSNITKKWWIDQHYPAKYAGWVGNIPTRSHDGLRVGPSRRSVLTALSIYVRSVDLIYIFIKKLYFWHKNKIFLWIWSNQRFVSKNWSVKLS